MRIKAFQGPQYICICLNCSYHQTASKELRGDELQAPFSSEFEFLPICYAALLISLWKLERNSISSENLLFFLDTLLTSPPTATQTRSTGFRWYFLLCNNYYLLPSRPEVSFTSVAFHWVWTRSQPLEVLGLCRHGSVFSGIPAPQHLTQANLHVLLGGAPDAHWKLRVVVDTEFGASSLSVMLGY